MQQQLTIYQSELEEELSQLLHWWTTYTIDKEFGGFHGKVTNDNLAVSAPKGLVLNARILYTFSAAYLLRKQAEDLSIATRAFEYLINSFLDQKNGGFYWSLTPQGKPLDQKKQVYGQSFAIYALAEYHKATQDEQALFMAKETYHLLEKHSYDPEFTGYIEAHTYDWQNLEDLRLSTKDQNDKKSMNTHLHVIEAYANLYTVWPNKSLKIAIKQLLANFKNYIIDSQTGHLQLFFDADWKVKSTLVSFGHDIEAAWLLLEAAEVIKDEQEIRDFKELALKMADASLRGLHKNGGLIYEFDQANQHWIKEFHWWPQAEAMVGFFNAWQISGNSTYLTETFKIWDFIKRHLKDAKNGEWFWGVDHQLLLMSNQDKAGFWKCPYHNGRACIEIIKRMQQML